MTETPQHVTIALKLTDTQALALAQFLKRATFDDFMRRAVDKDEAYDMQSAATQVMKALAAAGYAPR